MAATRKTGPAPEVVDEIVEPDQPEEDAEEAPIDGAEPEQGVEVEEARRPILYVRASVNSWWCPNDDTAMPHKITTCPVCGFIRP